MSGEELVKHLQVLGAPGAEDLVGESYDWLFQNGEEAPLTTFLQWFINNITPNNVLSQQELQEFETLQCKGEMMSPTQLQEMERVLSSVPSLPEASEHGLGEPPPSPQELTTLQEELELLTMRKNMLNAHKTELHNEMHQLNSRLHRANINLRRQMEAASTTALHFNDAQEKLGGVVDSHLNTFHTFDEAMDENALFLSQMDLGEWDKEEEKFSDLLSSYTQKQFKEGVGVVAGTHDSSQYVLLDINKLELSLVRGTGEEQYSKNVAELKRLNALLPHTEEWRLIGLILQERRKGEVAEAERLLAALHQGHLPSVLPVLRQQSEDLQASLVLVEKECRQQHQTMKTMLYEVSQLESTKTISGDYELKLQRQGYYLNKQSIVMDQLVSQAARYNWVIIALQTEGQRVTNMLQVLKNVNKRMTDRDKTYIHRMLQLDGILKKSDEDKTILSLSPPLHTMSLLLPTDKHTKIKVPDKDRLLKQIEDLQRGLSLAQEQITTITSPQFSCLSQMLKICDVLEGCLFGTAGSLQPLPLAWLEGSLAHRCHEAEHKVRELKQNLIEVMAQYEKKKKIIQVDPSIKQNLRKWINDIMTTFSS